MIEHITSQFDWVFQMPIESQCHFAIGLSLAGFLFAAIVRETCKESSVRYVARAVGAASFFAVAAFAHHVAHENEKLYSELMVRKHQKASEIGSGAIVTLTTKRGYEIRMGRDNGLRRIADKFRERYGCLGSGCGIHANASAEPTSRIAAGTMGRVCTDGSRDDGMVASRSMLEWAERIGCDLTGVERNAKGFEFTGDGQGKDF